MARITDLELWKNSNSPANSLPCVVGDYTVYIDFGSALDINQAKQILEQKRDALTKETEHLSKKLANEAYKNAKPEQWADDNALLNAKQTERAKLASLIDAM